MSFLLLAALIQAPTIEDRIDSFLKGDEASRGELMKLGAQAIRPLQKARDRNPEKIDPLVFEIKRGVAHPHRSKVLRELDIKVTIAETQIRLDDDPERARIDWGEARRGLPSALVLLDFKRAEMKAMTATVRAADQPSRDLLDQLCRQTGLDYGFFHHAVVIGPPDRLWPSGFGPAFATIQSLDPVDAATLKDLEASILPSVHLVDASAQTAFDYVLKPKQIESTFKVAGSADVVLPLIDARDLRTLDVLSLVAQAAGYDLAMAEGKVVVDTREALEKACKRK